MRKLLSSGLLGLLVLAIAACGASATPTAPPAQAPAAQAREGQQVEAPSGQTQLVTRGEKFKFQYVNVTHTVETFPLLEDFARRVYERTDGQVEITLTSYPELGISGFDALRLIKNGSLEFSEVYSGFVGGDFPLIEMGELLGLFPDAETQRKVLEAIREDEIRLVRERKVLEAIREDEIRLVRERFNGEVLFYSFYPDQYFFSKRPLTTLADFRGLKTRSHSVPLGDLISALDAEPTTMTFAEVYPARSGASWRPALRWPRPGTARSGTR